MPGKKRFFEGHFPIWQPMVFKSAGPCGPLAHCPPVPVAMSRCGLPGACHAEELGASGAVVPLGIRLVSNLHFRAGVQSSVVRSVTLCSNCHKRLCACRLLARIGSELQQVQLRRQGNDAYFSRRETRRDGR